MPTRYFVAKQTCLLVGNQYWNVCDKQNLLVPDRPVAQFFVELPGAEQMAASLCSQLNGTE